MLRFLLLASLVVASRCDDDDIDATELRETLTGLYLRVKCVRFAARKQRPVPIASEHTSSRIYQRTDRIAESLHVPQERESKDQPGPNQSQLWTKPT